MKHLADDIVRKFLERQPTPKEYRDIAELLDLAPIEMRESPAAVFQVVMLIASIQQQRETLKEATWEAQQKVHHDLPNRIDEAAYKALNKMRDLLPINAKDTTRRIMKVVTLCVVSVGLLCGVAGYIVGAKHERNFNASSHAASDLEFARCVDAASGAFAESYRRGIRKAPVSSDIVRYDLGACAAEYADRKATGS
ncbi:MAG: hypothetical protein ABGW87_06885 [Sphingomonadaceae bacterium]